MPKQMTKAEWIKECRQTLINKMSSREYTEYFKDVPDKEIVKMFEITMPPMENEKMEIKIDDKTGAVQDNEEVLHGFVKDEDELKPYQSRLLTEYRELHERVGKLEKFINSYSAGKMNIGLTCSIDLLTQQLTAMKTYETILHIRLIRECLIKAD